MSRPDAGEDEPLGFTPMGGPKMFGIGLRNDLASCHAENFCAK
jgi:hypothetical protein